MRFQAIFAKGDQFADDIEPIHSLDASDLEQAILRALVLKPPPTAVIVKVIDNGSVVKLIDLGKPTSIVQ